MTLKIVHNTNPDSIKIFKEYFDTYFDSIKNFIYYKTGDIDIAEDLSQDVFLKLWENMSNLKHQTVKAYIYTIASNIYKNHYNRKKVEYNFQVNFSDLNSESPEFIMETNEFNKQLQKSIEKIPEKSRIVFLMNRIDQLTYSEIAERLDLSVKAVEKRMKIALGILKKNTDHKI